MKPLKQLPIIGITMGDPLGIGPEILVKAFNNPQLYKSCKPLIIGDSSVILQALKLLDLNHKIINIIKNPKQGKYQFNTLDIIDISNINMDYLQPLEPDISIGKAMQDYILTGVDLALKNHIHALVTCPVTKYALKLAGSKFPGHTEILAHKTNTKDYAMMLAGEKLKVVLVTIHIPLSKVSSALTIENIIKKIKLTHTSLKERFNIQSPKIVVAGLNPHAGEASMFGDEEDKIIAPAVRLANQEGFNVDGPMPPDTVFYQAVYGKNDSNDNVKDNVKDNIRSNGKYDAVICMYHDQGLIPFKLIHFKDGVNTTLGLPIIRTSVDHGTAYDIAWKAIADPLSLVQAINMAILQANNIQKQKKV